MKRADQTYLSGMTEDYSNYRWYKGEAENPFTGDKQKPLLPGYGSMRESSISITWIHKQISH